MNHGAQRRALPLVLLWSAALLAAAMA